MNIDYDFMDDILDRMLEVKKKVENECHINAAFQMGIVCHILRNEMDKFEDSLEKDEDCD